MAVMHRTTIMLPEGLKARATQRAARLGISFGQLVREALEAHLGEVYAEPGADPLFAHDVVYDGPAPTDLAARHDAFLYGDGE